MSQRAETEACEGRAQGDLVARGAAGDLTVRASEPGDDPARDRLALACPGASFFHLSGWRRAVERVFGHESRDLVALRGEELVGVLPLMRSPGLGLARAAHISMPYGVYGGPCGDSPEIELALVRAAVARAERERVGRLELRCQEELPGGLELERSDLYATFVQELPASPGEVLGSLPKKARAEARKARQRHGLRLTEGRWYLEDLSRLFQVNKRQLGSPALPLLWFQTLLDVFGERVRVHLVQRGSLPVAAVMSFLWRDTLMAYYAGSAPDADRELSASNFMYMALREWAVEQGLRRFDFGRSRTDSGAYRFKEHQGFSARPLPYSFHLVRDRERPSFHPSNPRTQVLRDTWARLPAALTRRLSQHLSRYLP
jgi:FemAB-related protein (PEP-CTERM system-associated)